MKKTISINLGGQAFTIEEEAYNRLRNYLEEIKKHCGQNADADEVVSDIELGMAEKFKTTLSAYKEIITLDDVESLIKVMGTPEDFDREVGDNPKVGEEVKEDVINNKLVKRRLYRDVDNRLLGGVAAGLGAYFEVDPLIFRLLFFASIFAGGFGLGLYLLLWLIVPAARSVNQKLEMNGEAPTLAAFERFSKNSMAWKDNWKKRWQESSWIKKIISLPFLALDCLIMVLKKIWSKLWPAIRFIFGFGFICFSLLALGIIGVSSLYAILEAHSVYRLSYVPIAEISSSLPFIWMLLSAFLSLAIPALFLLFAGIIIVSHKNFMRFSMVAILISLWMVAGIACISMGLRYGPDVYVRVKNYPALQLSTRQMQVNDLKKINVSGDYIRLIVESGATSSVSVSGRNVDIKNVDLKNDGDTLSINRQRVNEEYCLSCKSNEVTVTVTAPDLNYLKINGADVELNKITSPEINFEVSKNSSLNISEAKIASSTLTLLNGSSDVNLDGEIKVLTVNSSKDTSSVSTLSALSLKSQNIILNLQGSPKIVLGNPENIQANLSNQARVYYGGQPKISGDLKNKGVMHYTKISETEYDKETQAASEKQDENAGEESKAPYRLYSDGLNYYHLERGQLGDEVFSEMSESF